jgi:gas vesicle protein
MELSSDLVSQFVKSTNDRGTQQKEIIVHGAIVTDGTNNYVQLDGSSELAPISSTVEVSPGDRVLVTIQNHTATVTGNTTDPAIGTKTAGDLRSSITQTAEQIRLEVEDTANKLRSSITMTAEEIRSEVSDEVDGLKSNISQTASEIRSEVKDSKEELESKITQTAEEISQKISNNEEEFTEFKQTVEGWEFVDENGSLKIENGFITWDYLAKDAQDKVNDAQTTADNAAATAGNAQTTANSAYTNAGTALAQATSAREAANIAYTLASNIKLPSYLNSTSIGPTTIMSPAIVGGTFWAVAESGSYLQITPTGIDVYDYRAVNPKFSLTSNSDFVQMILGSGISNTNESIGRLYFDKGTDYASIYYRSSITNVKTGFTFNDNGTITVHGSLSGVSSSTTAVWG